MEKFLDSYLTQAYWKLEYFGNTLRDYAEAAIVFAALFLLLFVVQKVVVWRLRALSRHTKTDLDDTFVKIADSIKPPIVTFLALYFSARTLAMDPLAESIFDGLVLLAVAYQVIVALHIFIDYVFEKILVRKVGRGPADPALAILRSIAKWSLWVVGILFIVQNFGINVTSLVAGLGIGGIAVALAAQNVLGDLFSSFAISFDRPFEPGDFVIVGQDMGTVKKIGLKTTRLEALQGEEIVISNQELTSARIQNFKKMQERRIVFTVGVEYDTPQEQLKKIPAYIRDAIESTEGTRFDRSHFVSFGDSSLDFESVYYVRSGDYSAYMDSNQEILLKLNETFRREGISVAYPTQVVHVKPEA